MSLEQSLERIAVALESLGKPQVTTMGTFTNVPPTIGAEIEEDKKKEKKTKKKKEEQLDLFPEEEVEKQEEATEESLRSKFREYIGKHGKKGESKLIKLIGEFGASKIVDVDAKDYAPIIAKVAGWLK